jgi:hypothetical protein
VLSVADNNALYLGQDLNVNIAAEQEVGESPRPLSELLPEFHGALFTSLLPYFLISDLQFTQRSGRDGGSCLCLFMYT